MEPNPFLKRLMKEQTEDVVHSSAYGKAQNEKGMGVASTEGFEQRRAIDLQRNFVRKYGESRVANQMSGAPRAKVYEPAKDTKMAGGAVSGTGVASGSGRIGGAGNSRMGGTGSLAGGASPSSGAGRPPMRRNPGISR